MVEIFTTAPELEKLTRGEDLEYREKMSAEEKLCETADDKVLCYVDVRSKVIEFEAQEITERSRIEHGIAQVLERHGVAVAVSDVTPEPVEPVTPRPEPEPVKNEVLEDKIFTVLSKHDGTAAIDTFVGEIVGYTREEIQEWLFDLIIEGLLEQTVRAGEIMYTELDYSEPERDVPAEIPVPGPTVSIQADELKLYEGEWLDEHEDHIVAADMDTGEIVLTAEGYDELMDITLTDAKRREEMEREAIMQMRSVSTQPGLVEELWHQKERGEISPDDFQEILMDKAGEDEYVMIRQSIIETMEKYGF